MSNTRHRKVLVDEIPLRPTRRKCMHKKQEVHKEHEENEWISFHNFLEGKANYTPVKISLGRNLRVEMDFFYNTLNKEGNLAIKGIEEMVKASVEFINIFQPIHSRIIFSLPYANSQKYTYRDMIRAVYLARENEEMVNIASHLHQQNKHYFEMHIEKNDTGTVFTYL